MDLPQRHHLALLLVEHLARIPLRCCADWADDVGPRGLRGTLHPDDSAALVPVPPLCPILLIFPKGYPGTCTGCAAYPQFGPVRASFGEACRFRSHLSEPPGFFRSSATPVPPSSARRCPFPQLWPEWMADHHGHAYSQSPPPLFRSHKNPPPRTPPALNANSCYASRVLGSARDWPNRPGFRLTRRGGTYSNRHFSELGVCVSLM